MSGMDGDELKESLQMQMQGEIEVLEQSHRDAKKMSAYQVLMREIKPDQWTKAESKQSLGYNRQSRRTQQRRNQWVAKAEEKNKMRALYSSSKNCSNVWPFCNVWIITQ